jgi:hypothetical protein
MKVGRFLRERFNNEQGLYGALSIRLGLCKVLKSHSTGR